MDPIEVDAQILGHIYLKICKINHELAKGSMHQAGLQKKVRIRHFPQLFELEKVPENGVVHLFADKTVLKFK